MKWFPDILDLGKDEDVVKLKVSREMRQRVDDYKRDYQQLTEDFFTDIDPELGDINRSYHKKINEIHDIGKNIYDTVYNARDAVDIARYEHFHVEKETILTRADHLFVYRLGYTHHGLYLGGEQVIHYARNQVRYDNLDEFTKGCKICLLPLSESPVHYTKEEVIDRAKSRLGEARYNLITNNCEHFVRWCRAGREP